MPEPETVGATTGVPSPESVGAAERLIYEQLEATGVELERVGAELEKHREAALGYLRADYLQTHAFTKTILCSLLGHPEKYPEGQAPIHATGGCPCGMRRDKGTA